MTFDSANCCAFEETVSGNQISRYFSGNRRFKTDLLRPSLTLKRKLSANKPLGDSLKIYPVPLLLSASELRLIKKGSRQRLLALALWFEDLFLKRQWCIRDRLISRLYASKIAYDSGWTLSELREVWEGKKFRDISILSGADLIRTPQGSWAVIEDNIGGTDRMLGGIADIQFAHPTFLEHLTGSKNVVAQCPKPLTLFLKKWRSLHSIEDSTLLVTVGLSTLLYKSKKIPDREEFRVSEIIQKVFPNARLYGELMLSFLSPLSVSNEHYRAVLNLGPDCRKAIRPHFISYFKRKEFPFFTSIGTEILANKALLPFVDRLIRYYLKEEVLIPTVESSLIENRQLTFERTRTIVAKRCDSMQGTAVHIFPRMKKRKQRRVFSALKRDIRKNTTTKSHPLWIEQEYVRASFMRRPEDGRKLEVNIRPFAYLTRGEMCSSPLPWGRIGTKADQPLVNISQGAEQLIVLGHN